MESPFSGEAARPQRGEAARHKQSKISENPRSQRLLLSATGLVALAGLGALAALFTAPFADPPAAAGVIHSSAAAAPAAIVAENPGNEPIAAAKPESLTSSPAKDPKPVASPEPPITNAAAQPQEPAEALPSDDPRWAKTGTPEDAPEATPSAEPATSPAPAASPDLTARLGGTDATAVPGETILQETAPQDGAAAPDEATPPDETETAAIPPAEPVVEAVKPKPKKQPVARAATSGAKPSSNVAVTSAVKMRARPAKGAAVVTVVPARAAVGLVSCKAWCEVVYKGRRGFIYKSFIDGRGIASGQDAAQQASNQPPKPRIVPPTGVDINSVGR